MLDEFFYEDRDINQMIMTCLSEVSMTGIIGSIYFEEGGDPIKNVKIERIQGKDARSNSQLGTLGKLY